MKDQEFIELLNLYLDHEISAGDAARLETEVQGNPQRRVVYTQYCRMQKACTVLGIDFRPEDEGAFDLAATAVERARRRRQAAYYGVGTFAAAAACVAFILIGRAPQSVNEAVVGNRPAEIAAVTAPDTAPRAGGIVQRPMLVDDPLLLSGLNRPDAELTVAARQAAEQLEWLHAVKLAPLQLGVAAEGLRFDVVPATLQPANQDLRKRQAPASTQFEWVGFEFTK